MQRYVAHGWELLPEEGFRLTADNRAFRYGDGLFETMVFDGERVRFFADHYARLTEGMAALRLEAPGLTAERLLGHLRALVERNGLTEGARLRLQVYRAGAGKYTPQTNRAAFFAEALESVKGLSNRPVRLSYCRSATLRHTDTSRFKTCNALPYVLAGIERQERGGGALELVLRGENGAPAEATASNLFWLEGRTLVTPDLRTGCVNGVMRKNVIRWAESERMPVRFATRADGSLERAESAFLTNATGIRQAASLEQSAYKPFERYEKLSQALGLR